MSDPIAPIGRSVRIATNETHITLDDDDDDDDDDGTSIN